MRLPRLRLWHGLIAASLAWGLGVHAAALSVQPLSHRMDVSTVQKFPFVQSENTRLAARINQWLFLKTFEIPAPARMADGLRGVDAQTWQNMPELGYTVLRNDARVLSLRIEGEGCGAYCENFTYAHAFDAATGRHLEAADLFTSQGLQAIARKIGANNAATLRKEIASLQKAKKAPQPKDGPSADGLDAVIGLYEDCLSSRGDIEYRRIAGVGRMEIEAGSVLFAQDRCSNHAMRALDDIGDFSTRIPASQLGPWLTGYGRRLLLGEGSALAPTSPFGQVLHGTIDGKLPITLRLPLIGGGDGQVNAVYFYDRYRTPIPVSGQYKDGVLTLEEGESKARLRLKSEGLALRGEWTSGQKTLPMVLAP
ncbi:hypothetical protein NU688_29685 [Variovorax sp. ZS18.2.2]|uniref:hypothetical protein n=1 Tax=Variovorax sp. ZS18.2.2 TaxID=2971255 RepID=UPI0021508AD3|nr:hypothetical protein [Variovorax sp. ZS18.2.2]MCR6480364.1 hypothetical protein [Variovorax sp. ZS18.2.2]